MELGEPLLPTYVAFGSAKRDMTKVELPTKLPKLEVVELPPKLDVEFPTALVCCDARSCAFTNGREAHPRTKTMSNLMIMLVIVVAAAVAVVVALLLFWFL